jgi:predicted DNA-binding transcriptional regulator AlpA
MINVPRRFPEFGLVRLGEIVAPNGVLAISRSSFLAGVKAGRFPQPVKLGPRTTAWDAAEIRAFIAALQDRDTAMCSPSSIHALRENHRSEMK